MPRRVRGGATGRVGTALLLMGGALVWAVSGLAQTEGQGAAWQSVEILVGASAEDMDVFMRAMNASLGTECDFCHEPGQWHLESRPQKEAARGMMRMIARLSATSFEALDLPTCWTCHRGNTIPAPGLPVVPEDSISYPAGTFAATDEPAGQVYGNVQQYIGMPAEDLAGVMEGYSAALGVGCDYCHLLEDFASDDKVTKLLSRRMLEIQREVQGEFFEGGPDLSCGTCHQGQAIPALALPPDLISDP